MDHSFVQRILDHANTRGTAILMRTISEIMRDRKIILVAFISLLPILIGVLWSSTLSDDEDIRDEDIENIRDTSDIFCYVDVPDYLPNTGNYTFQGRILNWGDTTQQIAVNMTIGNAKVASTGIHRTTGIMNVTPIVKEGEPGSNSSSSGAHDFSITYDMNDFKEGTTFIVIQMYVKNSFSATRLIPDEFDLTIIDFDQFNLESLVGRNDAVWMDEIVVQRVAPLTQTTQELFIGKENDIMPLNLNYSSLISPEEQNVLHLSVAEPLNESRITVQITLASNGALLGTRSIEFDSDQDIFNFTLTLPKNFTSLGFDTRFLVRYRITYGEETAYIRNGQFTMDLVKKEFLHLAENRTLLLANNTLYSGNFDHSSTLVRDYHNTFRVSLTNNDITEKWVKTNITLVLVESNSTSSITTYHSHYTEIPLEATGNITTELMLPFILQELYNSSYPEKKISMDFSFEVDGIRSNIYSSGPLSIRSFGSLVQSDMVSLEDTFTTSLRSYLSLPEDISKKRSAYNVTCTINNTAAIGKEFQVKVYLQGNEYVSDWITVGAGEEEKVNITVLSGNLTKEFNADLRVEVYSSRTLEADDPEAKTTVPVNVISQGHKERKVLENFLFVYVQLYIGFIVPLAAMVYGISLISQESERRTLALYLTTPITKIELILYKFGGYLVAMTVVLAIPLILIYLSFSYVLPPDLIIYYLLLLGVCLFDLFLAVAAYGAVFTTIGTIERRPVFIGLSYLMVWEVFMGYSGFFLKQYTLFYHIRSAVLPFAERYVPNATESMGLTDLAGNAFTISMEVAMITITLVVFVFLFLAISILTSRDVN